MEASIALPWLQGGLCRLGGGQHGAPSIRNGCSSFRSSLQVSGVVLAIGTWLWYCLAVCSKMALPVSSSGLSADAFYWFPCPASCLVGVCGFLWVTCGVSYALLIFYCCCCHVLFFREGLLFGSSHHQLSMLLQFSLSPSASPVSRKGAGPQTRTVPSSEAEAMRPGIAGFQLTQFTVRV